VLKVFVNKRLIATLCNSGKNLPLFHLIFRICITDSNICFSGNLFIKILKTRNWMVWRTAGTNFDIIGFTEIKLP